MTARLTFALTLLLVLTPLAIAGIITWIYRERR